MEKLFTSNSGSSCDRQIRTDDLVCVRLLLEIGVQARSGVIGLFLLMPAIFLVSIIFDRGSGFYATILSTGLSITGFI
jgi:hypothetical protein